MSRTDDTIRPVRPFRGETTENGKETPPNSTPPMREDASQRVNRPAAQNVLSQEETIALAQQAVENGLQETKRSLAGSEAVDDVVRPKLTIDLGHSNIGWLPEALVDIIKDEVARLSLSNNHIDYVPLRFSECVHLRYLNIRANNFVHFPESVLTLSFLEILDLSRNKIAKIPEEIRELTSLRVLSIMQNLLEDLPDELADMNKLQVLKVTGNALNQPLKRVLQLKEIDISVSDMADNEKETAITAELKRYLKGRQAVDVESGSEAGENVIDVPRPAKRGYRFPVVPRHNGADSVHESRSPSLSRPPPIPTRSHHRIASGQNGAFQSGSSASRSGFNIPLSSSERNRSNSEGVLQGSTATRTKRMGLIRGKPSDLGTLDEMRPYRNSHLRGLSHGSLLKSRSSSTTINGGSSSSPSSPRERRRLRDGFVPRMSSLPEQKVGVKENDNIIEGAKNILYSLCQIHPHISSLITVTKEEEARRNSLEIVLYNASTHVDQLNDAIEGAENTAFLEGRVPLQKVREAVKRESETCVMAYIHVATQLRTNLRRVVSLGDGKYIRSLLLMIYGSLIELRNACSNFGAKLAVWPPANNVTEDKLIFGTVKDVPSDQMAGSTPTRERLQPGRRLRSDTTIQHPSSTANANAAPVSTTTLANYATVHSNSSGYGVNPGSRSRSSSRSNTIFSYSGASSLASTPRSGESFGLVPPTNAPRINPLTGMDEMEEERIFEKIFHQLTAAYTAALQAIPLAARLLSQCLELAEETSAPQELRMLWSKLIYRCRICLDVSEALHIRLSNMKLKEPGGGMRNQREFWQLCKTFIQSFVELVTDMREPKRVQLLPPKIVATLRPVQIASREAGRLIDSSPWSSLAELNTTAPSGVYPQQLHGNHSGHYFASSNISTGMPLTSMTSGSSPQSVTLPATPLSAALGPAAQATIPSTPVSAYSDRFFAGDVFQRADSLLSSAGAPVFSRR